MSKVIKVTYGDKILSDLFESVTNIKRDIGSGWNNNTQAKKEGVDVITSSRGPRNISFDYLIKGTFFSEINANKQKLASYINSEDALGLVFEDEPNKVWYALPDGEQSYEPESNKGTLTFLVPSGHAVSSFTNVLNLANSGGANGTITPSTVDGSVTAVIKNKGTLPAWLRFKIKCSQENGYIGIAAPTGAFEMGNIQEADGVVKPESEYLYNSNTDSSFSKFKDATGTTNPQNSALGTNGTISFQSDGLRFATQGTMSASQIAGGGMKVMTLPADSNGHVGAVNFYSHFNLFAWAGAMGQTGILQILFTDSNDKLVAGYGIVKSDMNGNNAKCTFWIGGNSPKDYASRDFETNNGERNQKKPNVMFNSSTGDADFLKEGANLGFYWNGSRQTAYVPELANVEVSKVYLYLGQFKGSNKFINNLSIRQINLTKNNVSVWKDVPNRYAANSEIKIDMGEGSILVNGISSLTEMVNGSNFFMIPPGETTIVTNPSNWVNHPLEIEYSWEENYL
ncbi:phage tail family protein [Lactococcus lactis]|uniref:distal tail protein Dit n=1 Tax=Lactococcus lactis TaxID=1358 RepID=UPI0025A08603|nr:distal tail protein Dit [Lactococcus lactis]MDM7651123.1 phage tail family protein [Lactococcus lactis]